MVFLLITLLVITLLIAFVVRDAWTITLPGIMLLILIIWLLFVPGW